MRGCSPGPRERHSGPGWPTQPGPQVSQLEQGAAHSWGGLSPTHRHVHPDLDRVAPVAPVAGLRVGKSPADSLPWAHPGPAGAWPHFFHLEGTVGEGPPRGGRGLGGGPVAALTGTQGGPGDAGSAPFESLSDPSLPQEGPSEHR